jgi:hypothetical protein
MENYSLADIKAAIGGEESGGFGGGWIFIIVLFLFMFMGWGGGFGGNRGEALTEAGFCTGMNFNNLDNSVANIASQQQTQFMQLSNGLSNIGYESLNNNWATRYDNLENNYALQQQIADCCCTSKALSYEGQIAGMNNTQKILDAICGLRGEMKDDRIAALQAQVNQLELQNTVTSATAGVIKYPTTSCYTSGTWPLGQCGCTNF